MIWLCIRTNCCLWHIICFGINMKPMWHHYIFICFIYAILFFTRPSVLRTLYIYIYILNNDHSMKVMRNVWFLADMQNSQPHMNLYLDDICFHWGDNSERNVESLIMILFSASLTSLSPPLYVSLIRLLWSSLTDTCSKKIETSYGPVGTSIFNFQFHTIIDNWWLHNLWMLHNTVIQRLLYLFIYFWIPSSIFFNTHGVFPYLISL